MNLDRIKYLPLRLSLWSRVFARSGAQAERLRAEMYTSPVLMVSSNGGGLGHLTRLWAVERRLDKEVVTYTLSSAYDKLGKPKSRMIYFPSYGTMGMYGRVWNILLAGHFDAVVKGLRPQRIVFDGTSVYPGIIAVAQKYGVPVTWIQRGCWKPEADARSKQRHSANRFADQVILPGDYGCEESVDVGLPPVTVGPIVLSDDHELFDRDAARTMLGLPLDKKAFLIQLGGSTIGDLNELLDEVLDAIKSLGDDWIPVFVRNPLATVESGREVYEISGYPLARYYNAFDAAIFPAGYNTSQECVQFGLPAVLVPNNATVTDDQNRRARTMAERGIALCAESVHELRVAINMLGEDNFREGLRKAAGTAIRANGAIAAAEAIESKL